MTIDPDTMLVYLDFAAERHAMYERRQAGLPQSEWTTDKTLATRKFTNVFRWLDPGSQFVITDLLPDVDKAEALFRCTLFRYTNYFPTWVWMHEQLGHYPTQADLPVLLDVMQEGRALGKQMFSGAYMIIPQPGKKGDKLQMVLEVTASVMSDSKTFIAAKSQEERHAVLTSHYGVGKFLGQQILTDFMYQYGTSDSENEFVVRGPGSARGAARIDPDSPTEAVIRWVHRTLLRNVPGLTLLGRQPSLMDAQNTLCEFSKYVRGPRASLYHPAHPGPLPDPVFPTAYTKG